jgi:DNA invertase Pin-like site-specific DNA recombinase
MISPDTGAAACVPSGTGLGFAVYARLSRKKVGRAKKRRNQMEAVERQIAIVRRWAAEQGIPISEDHIYIDNHLSAWRREGERPAWEAMLAAAERGEFPGILVYKLDRFTRNTPDAYALTRLGDRFGLIVDGPYSGRINLRTAQGRKTFRDAASAAEFESDNTSERSRDALAERTAMGLQLGGGRLYGFEILSEVREDDDDTEPVQRPDEVKVIQEAARRVIAGDLWKDIADDLNEQGLRTVRGNLWNGKALCMVVGSPRNAGYVLHKGKIVARNPGKPILDDDTYARVQAIIAGRKKGPRPKGLFKLSGVVLCAAPVHGDRPHPMGGHRHRDVVRDYYCSPSSGGCGAVVVAEPVEAIVRERVLRDANDPDTVAALSAEAHALSEARMDAAAKVDRLDGLLADLEARKAAETIRELAYQAAKAVLDKRIAEAEAEAKRLGAGSVTGDVPALTGEEYDALTWAETWLLVEQLDLRVLVLPVLPDSTRGKFDHRRVRIEPYSGPFKPGEVGDRIPPPGPVRWRRGRRQAIGERWPAQ